MVRRLPAPLLLLCSLVAATGAPASTGGPEVSPTAPQRAATGSPKSAGAILSERHAEQALAQAKRLIEGRGDRTGREVSLALRELAIRLPALGGPERREARALLARPTDITVGGALDENSYAPGTTVRQHCPATSRFCVHWVETTDDAPSLADANGVDDGDGVPDYVELVAGELARSDALETGNLGWRPPKSDGTVGGGIDRTDAYVKELAGENFGYAVADDPDSQTNSRYGYLVLDDDYAEYGAADPAGRIELLQATAAHEYNHLLQFAYDVFQDVWMFESTATWMEDKVYDEVNDYLRYLPDWALNQDVPLTADNDRKVYGSAVWNTWLDERFGQTAIREAWEKSLQTDPASFAPEAYGASLATRGGGTFSDAFSAFSAATAEWRTGSTGFSEGATFPDLPRRGTLVPNGPGVALSMDHTTFALYGVPPPPAPELTLSAALREGTSGALALVAREANGAVTTSIRLLPGGGQGSVVLASPARFVRITAVLVNSDVSQSGWSSARNDWAFTKDAQPVIAAVSVPGDVTPPGVTGHSPTPGAGSVPLSTDVSATFSEPVAGVSPGTFQLIGPDGRTVPAGVFYDPGSVRAVLRPAQELSDTTAYTARLTRGIADARGNPLPEAAWTFTTVARPPLFRLAGSRRQRGKAVRRKGLPLKLSSTDPDPLSYSVAVRMGRKAAGKSTGSVAPRGTARTRVRLSRQTRKALGARRRVRLTVQATVHDPQGNVGQASQTFTVRP